MKLSQEGLVHMERHRGATVAQLGLDAVYEIYSLRTSLERLAAEWLCRNATAADFKRMAEVLSQFDKLARPLTRSAVAGLDVAFHDAIYQAAHHERLYQAWLGLRSQIFLYLVHRGALRADFAESWRQDHEDLLEVLTRRKRVLAVKIVDSHIEGTYQRVLAANRDAADRSLRWGVRVAPCVDEPVSPVHKGRPSAHQTVTGKVKSILEFCFEVSQ